VLMLSSNNILKPADGRPVAEPSQDIVLGCYFATKGFTGFDDIHKDPKKVAALHSYTSASEVEMALALGRVNTHTPLRFLVDRDGSKTWEVTTVGRVLFNQIIPAELPFQNRDIARVQLLDILELLEHRSARRGVHL